VFCGTTVQLKPLPRRCFTLCSIRQTHTYTQRLLLYQYTIYTREEDPCSQWDSNPRPQQSRATVELHFRRHCHRDRLCACLGVCKNTSKLIRDIILRIFMQKGTMFEIAFVFTGEKYTLKCLKVLSTVPKVQLRA